MNYYIEAGFIVEYPEGQCGVLFNDVYTKHLTSAERKEFVQALIVIARDWAFRDVESVDPDQIITTTPIANLDNAVMAIRFLLDPDMNFAMNVYFGGRANTSKTIREGMQHAIEIITEVENNLIKNDGILNT